MRRVETLKMFSLTLDWLRSPGARAELHFAAPSHTGHDAEREPIRPVYESCDAIDSYVPLRKQNHLDRWLDYVVQLSGSEFTYGMILLALVIWAFLGIPYGTSSTYKIIISDAQAIINLVFDAFLMRQQFIQHDNLLRVAGFLRSRIVSHKRMIENLVATGRLTKMDAARFQLLSHGDEMNQLPQESRLTRISSAASWFLGHIGTVIGFWCCIFVWLGFGPYSGWSTTWQLYINSATSALMVLLLAFLANVRERHGRYQAECLKAIWKIDSTLEIRLREMTGDQVANPTITLAQRRKSTIQRAIDYYADLVGTLAGIAILIVVLLAWFACGPALHFNANWWLLIGTYAGLVGLNDGFVLRNICQVFGDYEDEQFARVNDEDLDILVSVGVGALNEKRATVNSSFYRASIRMGRICSHGWTVVGGIFMILALIGGASAMRWNVTGQLLCNIPPSVVESFLTLILITGHNVGEAKRRVDLYNIHLRRAKLISYLELQGHHKMGGKGTEIEAHESC